ncbi:YjzC family protein [Sorangium sp. So ce1153]|uniref:YjzC family protein n=1 Tax=Sorangium sp. So ce1153 TaxID=3133333 RepID=UPI003F63C9E1
MSKPQKPGLNPNKPGPKIEVRPGGKPASPPNEIVMPPGHKPLPPTEKPGHKWVDPKKK